MFEGAAAAALGAAMLNGKERPLDEVIREDLTAKEREKLADAVLTVIRREIQSDCGDLVERVVEDEYVEGLVVQEMRNFFRNMDMSINY